MHAKLLLTALALVPFVAGRAQAQSFAVKVKMLPDAGKSVEVTDTSTVRSSVTVTLDGKILKTEKKVQVEEKQFTEKVLEAGVKVPTKYTWTFGKATKGKEGERANFSYAGKTILYEKQGGAYKVTVQGDGVDEKDLDALTKQANQLVTVEAGTTLLPKGTVKVGDSWPIDQKEVLAQLGEFPKDALDLGKLKAHGRLAKAYKKNSQQWGAIETIVSVPIKKVGGIPLDKPIELQSKSTMDAAIDGSSTVRTEMATFTMKGRAELTQNNMTIVLDIAVSGKSRREVGGEK